MYVVAMKSIYKPLKEQAVWNKSNAEREAGECMHTYMKGRIPSSLQSFTWTGC